MVYAGLNCESIVYQGYVDSDKRINLLCVEVTKHYHVIANLTEAMAKRNVCEGCKYGALHPCEQTSSDCMLSPPCISADLEFRATYATGTAEVTRATITIKRKPYVYVRRVRVIFVSVAVLAAL